jgi:hypothetical protein
MSDTSDKNIRAHREIIWHLTCGHCHYYWTYPTMNMNEDITKKSFHCPLCGVKSHASIDSDLPDV